MTKAHPKEREIVFDVRGFIEACGGNVKVHNATGYSLDRIQKWSQRGSMPLPPALHLSITSNVDIRDHVETVNG